MLTVGILAGCAGAKQRAPRNWQSLDWSQNRMALNCKSLICSVPGGHLPEIDAGVYSATDTVSAAV
jgi:hypothetical protein